MSSDRASTSAQKRVSVVCDFLGITNLNPDAVKLVDKLVHKTLLELLINSRKWCENSGRLKLVESDVSACLDGLPHFVHKAMTASTLKSNDLIPISQNGKIDVFADAGVEGEVGQMNSQLTKIPVENRLKGYFIVLDGVLVETPYNYCKSWKLDEEENEEKNLKEEKRKVARFQKPSCAPTAKKMFQDGLKNAKMEQIVALKPAVPEILSLEQQIFLKDIMTVVMGTDDKFRAEGLVVIETDAGLQDLLPYLVQMVSRSIAANISQKCLSLTIYASRIIRALTNNKDLNLTPVLHVLIPSCLSCILGRTLSLKESDNHWALRDYAAKTAGMLIKDHAHHAEADFRLRIFNYSMKVLTDPKSTRPMMYGAAHLVSDYVPPEQQQNALRFIEELAVSTHSLAHTTDVDSIKNECNKLIATLTKSETNIRQKMQ